MRFTGFLICLLAWSAQAADHLECLSLSHSGKLVAMQEADGSSSLIDTLSGSKKPLGKSCRAAAEFVWAPDDKAVYITCRGEISGYAVPGGQLRVGITVLAGGLPGSLTGVSPDGRHVSFIRDNNLWISATSSATGRTLRALTQAGNDNLLIGAPDLVYAREFDVKQHYWWSPDSSSIAYIETEFEDAKHYVVPGGKLPIFRVNVIDITTGQTRLVAESNDDWAYFLRVAWSADSKRLVFYRMNRLQNLAELRSFENGSMKTLLTEKDAYWVNAPATPLFVAGSKRMVVSSERSGNKHIYLYESDGQLIKDLTPADLEVYKLHSTQDPSHVYVSGSYGNREEQQLFRLNLDAGTAGQVTEAVGWHEVKLNAAGNAYLDYYSSASKPPSVEWHATQGKVREIFASQADEKPVANEFFTIKTHDNIALPARLFKPHDFDTHKKYPVILYTFSGPRGRVVTDQWGDWQMAWNRSMVRQEFLVLAVDVRGSAGYGHLFEEYIHYRFGAQEIADLREVVSYLRMQTYVDGNRLGIWGCNYGAHTVVHAMWQFPGGFKAGFADSPISDWTKFDAYFTERYLGLPANRFNEYNDSTPLHDARKMTGTLLVMSGGNDPLILPDQMEALKKAMAGVKNQEVVKRFQALPLPEDLGKLMAEMTGFFKQTL